MSGNGGAGGAWDLRPPSPLQRANWGPPHQNAKKVLSQLKLTLVGVMVVPPRPRFCHLRNRAAVGE